MALWTRISAIDYGLHDTMTICH